MPPYTCFYYMRKHLEQQAKEMKDHATPKKEEA